MLAVIFPIVVCVTLAYPIFKIFSVKGVAFYPRCSARRVVQQACVSGLFREKFAKDFGHERLMQNVTVNTIDYRIYIQGLKPHVLEQDLKFISPDFLNQYV